MKIINTYSFRDGEKFLKTKRPKELAEILRAIKNLDAATCLTKESAEKTMRGALLFSPRERKGRGAKIKRPLQKQQEEGSRLN